MSAMFITRILVAPTRTLGASAGNATPTSQGGKATTWFFGQPQSNRGNPLTWPAADPPLPFTEPPWIEVRTQNDEVFPYLEFENAPWIDVIKTLANLADLNVSFDPRVLEREYPPVTIRLRNVSAINVMESLLNLNGLRLETDPSTETSRITL